MAPSLLTGAHTIFRGPLCMLHWEWPMMPGSANLSYASQRYPHGINGAESQEDGNGYLQTASRFVMYRKSSQMCTNFQQVRKKSRTAKPSSCQLSSLFGTGWLQWASVKITLFKCIIQLESEF